MLRQKCLETPIWQVVNICYFFILFHPLLNKWLWLSKTLTNGFDSLYLFTDNLNAEKMLKIYQKCLVTSAEKFYGKNRDNWKLQEDNDSKRFEVVFVQNGKLKMASPQWIGLRRLRVSRCKSDRKCVVLHQT